MKTSADYEGNKVTVYVLELCHYGDRGDFEIFPDRELDLDVEKKAGELENRGYNIECASPDVLIFHGDAGMEFTLYPDGRLIVESLRPGSTAQAMDIAKAVIGYA
jgi:hypothetical protein